LTKSILEARMRMYQLCGGTFTWNSEKARMNLAKHGVSFEEACEALLDLFHVDEDAGVPEGRTESEP
jgi:uncharacterized protein